MRIVAVFLLVVVFLLAQTYNVSNTVSSSGTYAQLPTSCTPGQIYIPTNSLYQMLRCPSTGVPWQHFLFGLQLTPPVLSEFAWVNQASATAVEQYGGITLANTGAEAIQIHALVKAAPAPPYTVTVAFTFPENVLQNRGVGVLFREAGTGELHVWGPVGSSTANEGWGHYSQKWTNPTTVSTNYVTYSFWYPCYFVWLRIQDNGVNRVVYSSADGLNWTLRGTVGRTDFLTANQIGVFVRIATAASPFVVQWLHWKVE